MSANLHPSAPRPDPGSLIGHPESLTPAPIPEQVDVIVVGAGAAGCVVAARLSEDPGCRVLLLEAGTATGEEDSALIPGAAFTHMAEASWPDVTVPQEALAGRRLSLAQGRGVGGGSSINFMYWFQGQPVDYDGWERDGAAGWGWSDVLPYLRRSESTSLGAGSSHGGDGPMTITRPRDVHPLSMSFIAAGVEQGLPLTEDFNGTLREGFGLVQSNIRDGARHSVVAAYLRPAAGRPNLTIATGVLVTSVVIEAGRATGVRYRTSAGGGPDREVSARTSVVLSAGALRTPQLLMLSGVGPAAHLHAHGIDVVADLPGVGQNLHDHPLLPAVWPVTDGSRMLSELRPEDLRSYQLLRRGPLASLGQAAALLRTDERLEAPDIQLSPLLIGLTSALMPLEVPAVTCVISLVTPSSRGSVQLSSADPDAAPAVDPRYLSDPADRLRLRVALKRVLHLFEAPALSAVTGPPLQPTKDSSDAELDAWIQDNVVTQWHPVGTSRMGTDSMSVVDPKTLLVHGIQDLHVVDASLMPTITRGNPQAPTIMIAERAADILRSLHT
ncbi:MAG: GMC family oxidoreductase N-terminal domain-containing protein [Lapillicoccus sp.]